MLVLLLNHLNLKDFYFNSLYFFLNLQLIEVKQNNSSRSSSLESLSSGSHDSKRALSITEFETNKENTSDSAKSGKSNASKFNINKRTLGVKNN